MRHYCQLLVFVSGFNIMLLEMCGFRVLQVHFGSSIYVTGILISTIMVALAFGYYCGGRLSDRSKSLKTLLFALVFAALYISIADILLSASICSRLFALGPYLGYRFWPPSIASILLFAFPMFLLSLVTPFLVRWLAVDLQPASLPALNVGTLVGQLMAISTIGSVLGTLVTSFFLIPLLGVKATYLAAALSILVTGLSGLATTGLRLTTVGTVAVFVLTVLYACFARTASGSPRNLVYEAESHYGRIQVRINNPGQINEEIIYSPSNIYTHTVHYPHQKLRNFYFTDFLNYGPVFGARQYLLLGAGGGAAIRLLGDFDPSASIVGVDIDPVILNVAKRYFGVTPDDRVSLVAEDGRVYLEKTTRKFDYIMVDVFRNDSLPTHCITQEFYQRVSSRLSDDGIMVVNSNMQWQFLATGLEDYYDPLSHLSATIFQSGFRSLFYNNLHGLGLLYAFKRPIGLDEIRERIQGFAAREDVDLGLRASLALGYFFTMPVEAGWVDVQPFTDDIVPEHRIYSVDLRKFGGYEQRLRQSLGRPEWQQLRSEDNRDLKMITLRYLESKFYAPVDEERRATRYRDDLLTWLAGNEALRSQALVRYALLDEIDNRLLSDGTLESKRGLQDVYSFLRGRRLGLAGLRTGNPEMVREALLHLQKAM